ncbi:hypothetical protein KGM_211001 [Danaus plexippus plexippus]|uniref:Uncharacterized protein n=1 Tax=Danaus plexippus plexippus TaxID=278856 RepID=A0A212FNC4_DANPL|nr:hypothetical protein KGM_211001 [Danaus plexippus plexippus]
MAAVRVGSGKARITTSRKGRRYMNPCVGKERKTDPGKPAFRAGRMYNIFGRGKG